MHVIMHVTWLHTNNQIYYMEVAIKVDRIIIIFIVKIADDTWYIDLEGQSIHVFMHACHDGKRKLATVRSKQWVWDCAIPINHTYYSVFMLLVCV